MLKNTVIVGLLIGIILVFGAIAMNGNITAYWSFSSVLIVFGGTFASVVVGCSWEQLRSFPEVIKVLFREELQTPKHSIDMLVSFAERARREGLLALEDDIYGLDDEFLKKGIQLVVDGTDQELVRNILETEITFTEDRHRQGRQLMETAGAFAPAFGMIGTLIGLIAMLQDLQDPASIGIGMATALLTTLYGTLLANLVFNPLAKQLAGISEKEILVRELMIEGILSMQAGESPRIVEEKLKAFLSPKARDSAEDDYDAEEEMMVNERATV